MKAFKYLAVAVTAFLIGCVTGFLMLKEGDKPYLELLSEEYQVKQADEPQISHVDVSYDTSTEFIELQNQMIEEFNIDSIFLRMPLQTTVNVFSVLKNNGEPTTIRKIVCEYVKNRAIYDPIGKNSTNLGSSEINNIGEADNTASYLSYSSRDRTVSTTELQETSIQNDTTQKK